MQETVLPWQHQSSGNIYTLLVTWLAFEAVASVYLGIQRVRRRKGNSLNLGFLKKGLGEEKKITTD